MSEPMNAVEYDKWIRATYLILFDPKPDLPPEKLEAIRQQLYDLRRLIPDVLSVHIKENVIKAPQGARFACVIGYVSTFKLNELTSAPAFLEAYQRLAENCGCITSFGAELLDVPLVHSIRKTTPIEVRQAMTIRERLLLIVRDVMQVAVSHVTAETRWIEDLGAEAVELAYIYSDIDNEFGVKLPNNLELNTVRDAEAWLAKHLRS